MSFSRRLEGLVGDPLKIMWTAPSSPGYVAPATSFLSGEWSSLLRWVHCSWLEGVVDVVLDEPAILEQMLDGDLVVRATCVQEPLEVVLDGGGLVGLPLGREVLRSTAAARLSSRRRLSFFFFLKVPIPVREILVN
jgi:hypothetical protein